MALQLGDSLAILKEPGGLETLLINAGDLPLLAEIREVAERMQLRPGAFATLSLHRFVERAGPDDWASLVSRANANDNEDAMGTVVTVILRRAVCDAREVFQ